MSHLHGLWTRQLLREFEDICWSYNIELIPPVFEISRSEKTYGSWHPRTRTIKISADLIGGYSWDIVLQVLKHEMAHQFCSEVMGSDVACHGDDFQKACRLLGVPRSFRRSSGDLAGGIEFPDDPSKATREGRKFIAKVEKLLSLAASANKNEAALAMQKAGDLMEKYNLRDIPTEESQYNHAVIDTGRKRLEGYKRRICNILQEFFYVKVVMSRLYNPENDRYHKTMELLGRKENVEIAEYCYYFLEKKLRLLWDNHRNTVRGKGIRARNSYYLGLLEGFRDKLRQQENTRSGSEKKTPSSCRSTDRESSGWTKSIVCLENDPGLQKFMKQRYPRLVSGRKTTSRVDGDIFAAGKEKGGKIVFHKGITEEQGNKGYLVE